MFTRTLGAVVLWLGGAGLAVAQMLPPSIPTALPGPQTPTLPGATETTPSLGGDPSALPPPGAPLWKQSDSPQFHDTGDESDHEHDTTPGAVPGGCADKSCRTRPFRVWASAEYLAWWHKDGPLPAVLVTTGGATGTLGAPGTRVLYGGHGIDFDSVSGLRASFGVAGIAQCYGVEATVFGTQDQEMRFSAASGGATPVLARPVVNALTGLESAQLVGSPGNFTGRVDLSATTQFLGGEVNGLRSLHAGEFLSFDLLGGFRYLNLKEELVATQQTQVLAGGGGFGPNVLQPASSAMLSDSFRVTNQFFGGQLGGQLEYRRCNFFVTWVGKLALGTTSQTADLAGTTVSGAGTAPGGLLVLQPNGGHHHQNRFTFVPEAALTVGVQLTQGLRVFAGYNFIYWDDVVRPGTLTDRRVNPGLVPTSPTFGAGTGPVQPTFVFRRSDYWAQGINVGLALRF